MPKPGEDADGDAVRIGEFAECAAAVIEVWGLGGAAPGALGAGALGLGSNENECESENCAGWSCADSSSSAARSDRGERGRGTASEKLPGSPVRASSGRLGPDEGGWTPPPPVLVASTCMRSAMSTPLVEAPREGVVVVALSRADRGRKQADTTRSYFISYTRE